MSMQSSVAQGEASENVRTLLQRIESADPTSPDIDEDDAFEGWGHYQFTAGSLTLSTSLTSWQEVGNVATAFKLVAAAIKTCREARLMCKNVGKAITGGFLSDAYLEEALQCLEGCWVGTGGVCFYLLLFYSYLTGFSRYLIPSLVSLFRLPRLPRHLIATSRGRPLQQ
jgi:hypothetical protein